MHYVCDAGTMSDVLRGTCPVQNAKAGCAGSVMNLLQVDGFNHQVKIIQGVLEEECSSMLSEFFRKLREKKKQEKAALKAAQENFKREPEQ